ncbi:hypothetical protein DFA_01427 [Cavenderia fasciculata]|uniref:Tetratricopeptide-like helical domain-containing protein n=1 Tax=Cavenderia fasciculata TaxID=261658 RepID=F4PSR3_CACFS|nr:uncharacterized protein DFA_01427 [Cavenderia fasciculata]EGG21541.1 hypothetical protein DFA_01427 [Cavenderia fasciculata]|eukprot:XP_004359391.1 hypothetical protein DFA_01427 [Cavenderia fasciculata]
MKRIIVEYSPKIRFNVLSASSMSNVNSNSSRWSGISNMVFGYANNNSNVKTTTATTTMTPSPSYKREFSSSTTQESILEELNKNLDYYYHSNDPSHRDVMQKLADKLVELDANNYKSHLKSSTIYGEKLGDYEHAVKDLRKSIELMIRQKVAMGDMVHHLHQLASYYHKMDMYESAEDVYRRVLKIAPDNTANMLLLASSCVARGDYTAEVSGLFKKVLFKETENINAMLGLGTCLTSYGQLPEAEKLFQRVIDLSNKKPKETLGLVATMIVHESALRLGQLFQYRNMNEKAVGAFQTALSYHPTHHATSLVLAKTLMDINLHARAYNVIVDSFNHPNEDIGETMAMMEIQIDCLRHLKKYREALDLARDLESKMIDCGEAYLIPRMNLLIKTIDTMINFVSERINKENQFSLTDFLAKKGKTIKKARTEEIDAIADYSNSIYQDLSSADVSDANSVIFFDDVASLYRDISIGAILLINNKSKFEPKDFAEYSKYLVDYYNSFWVKE